MNSYDKKLLKILKEHGCYPYREGRGSHHIWKSPITGDKPFTMVHNCKRRHTANKILKDAGIIGIKI